MAKKSGARTKRSQTRMAIVATRFSGRTFGEQTSYLRGLTSIGRRYGIDVFVVEPKQLEASGDTFRVWSHSGKGWRKTVKRLPHVIYDRAWGISEVQKDRLARTIEGLTTSKGILSFNPPFGSKLDVHNMLNEHAELARSLPETHALTPTHVDQMAERYKQLFIKPIFGRQGKGIIHCTVTNSYVHIRRRTAKTGSAPRRVMGREKVIQSAIGKKDPAGYIVQQGLDLIKINKRAVDVRVIVQRNESGKWSVTGIGVRVGPKGGFVSNLHAGGTAMTLSRLLTLTRLGVPNKVLVKNIRTLALMAAEHMTQFMPTLGEVGVDIGIDRDGHPWILEVNRQPGRALFSRAKLRTAWKLSRVRIIQYARYLANLGISDHSTGPSAS